MKMELHQRVSIAFLVCLSVICTAKAQLTCSPLTESDLGSTTESFSDRGLLPNALLVRGEGQIQLVPVRIVRARQLCDTSGNARDTSSYQSWLVRYVCNSPVQTGCDGSMELEHQFLFECDSNNEWSATISGQTDNTVERNPLSNFSTEPDNQCRLCINPASSSSLVGRVDNKTFCDPCIGCTDGQGRCYSSSTGDVCCNFYQQGQCVEQCSSGLVNDSNFNCVCEELRLRNGTVTYSDTSRDIGSRATHACGKGFVLNETSPIRTCTISGWDSNPLGCEPVICPSLPNIDNGLVVVPTERKFESQATYTCVDDGFTLTNGICPANGDCPVIDETRTCLMNGSWSGSVPKCVRCSVSDCVSCCQEETCCQCKDGYKLQAGKCEIDTGNTDRSSCNTQCIIGIVLAIIAAIILAIVVVLVVYGVYKYMTNPATKLAKAGTEGLNGVARDNPLYLDPKDIVDDTVEVVP